MKRILILLLPLFVVLACSDSNPSPFDPVDAPELVVAAQSANALQGHNRPWRQGNESGMCEIMC